LENLTFEDGEHTNSLQKTEDNPKMKTKEDDKEKKIIKKKDDKDKKR